MKKRNKFPCGHTYDDHYYMACNPNNHGKKICRGTKEELRKCKSCHEWDSELKKCLFNSLFPNIKCKQFWSEKAAKLKKAERDAKVEFDYHMKRPPLYGNSIY